MFGLGVLAVLCSREQDPALRCAVVLARDYVSFPGSSPLGEVFACSCLQEVGGMGCLGRSLVLGTIKDSAASL